MKKILFTLLLLAACFTAKAQTTLVATLLDYNGTYQATYYGANALKNAYNDAWNGYTIVLSPGQFNSNFTISKIITIRGAGMCAVPEKNVVPTVLNGTLTFSFGGSYAYPSEFSFNMEGVCVQSNVAFSNNSSLPKGAQFTKCCFNGNVVYSSINSPWENVSFVDCYLLGETQIPSANSSVAFYNCVLKLIGSHNTDATVYMENCVAKLHGQSTDGNGIVFGNLRNCFLLNYQGDAFIPTKNCVCEHCYSTLNLFSNQTNDTNTVLTMEVGDLFNGFDGNTWTDGYDYYKLSSWAQTNCLGFDGSQMGIYGGQAAPFSPLTSAPQITQFSAPESTSNGTLRVTIQVEMPQ